MILSLDVEETSLPLRDYQKEIISHLFGLWQKGEKKVLVQSATGSGKSLIIVSAIEPFVTKAEHQDKIFVVAHKIELIEQLYNHIKQWLPQVEVGIIGNKSQYKPNLSALIQVVSIQALVYQKELPPVKLLIIDEAHHCAANSYIKLFQRYPEAYRLGLTATPRRIDGKGLRTVKLSDSEEEVAAFDHLILGPSIFDLQDQGHLCKFKVFAAKKLVKMAEQKNVRTIGGDYSAAAVGRIMQSVLYGEIIETWQQYANNKQTVVYAATVELSKNYVIAFQNAGVEAAEINAKTPAKVRKDIVQAFREKRITVLIQHSIIIEGFDVPGIECVVFLRPTQSLSVFFQAFGRGLRPSHGKEYLIVIEHTDTVFRLGLPTEVDNWSLDAMTVRHDPKLTCSCGHIVIVTKEAKKIGHAICDYCGKSHDVTPAEPDNTDKERSGPAQRVSEIIEMEERTRERIEKEKQLKEERRKEYFEALKKADQARQRQILARLSNQEEKNKLLKIEVDNLFVQQKNRDYKIGWVRAKLMDFVELPYEVVRYFVEKAGWSPHSAKYIWQEWHKNRLESTGSMPQNQ
jgi:superfamily II DNA or RNA helicase